MIAKSKLVGSVRPYFGRSIRPSILKSVVAASAETEECAQETLSPRDLLLKSVQIHGWQFSENDNSFEVTVPVGRERTQHLKVQFDQLNATAQHLVVVSSFCGPASNRNAIILLKKNARLNQAAFAVEEVDDKDLIVLRGFREVRSMNVIEFSKTMKSLARLADTVERKLLPNDRY